MIKKIIITNLLLCFSVVLLLTGLKLKSYETDDFKSRDEILKNKIGEVYAGYMKRYSYYSANLLQQTPMWHEERLEPHAIFKPENYFENLSTEKAFLQSGYCHNKAANEVNVVTWFTTATNTNEFAITGLGRQEKLLQRLLVKQAVPLSEIAIYKQGELDFLTKGKNQAFPEYCGFTHLIPNNSPVVFKTLKSKNFQDKNHEALNEFSSLKRDIVFDGSEVEVVTPQYFSKAPSVSRFSSILDGGLDAENDLLNEGQKYVTSCGGKDGKINAQYKNHKGIVTYPVWDGLVSFERRVETKEQEDDAETLYIEASEKVVYSEWIGLDLSCEREEKLYISCAEVHPELKKFVPIANEGYRFHRQMKITGWADKQKKIPENISHTEWAPDLSDSGCVWHDVKVHSKPCPKGQRGKIAEKMERYYISLEIDEGRWSDWFKVSEVNGCQ